MAAIVRLDTRGRVVIPNEFRERINLEQGDEVLINLDSETDTITISPTYGRSADLVKINIEFGDTPGCLAKIANKIAEMKIDMIITESRSSQRGKKARWNIVGDISKSSFDIKKIKKLMMQSGFVESISIDKITDEKGKH